MVTKPRGTKKSFSTVPQSEITVGELISRVRPRLEDAHKRGWDKWKDDNERPLNYDAGLSDADLLKDLNRLKSQPTPFRPPHSEKSLQSRASRDTQITSAWTLPATEFTEVAARLETLFEYNGAHDAAARWRRCQGRLTVEEAWHRIKQTGEVDDAFLAKLVEAVRHDALPTYAPGKNSRTGYAVQNEVDERELDTWLKGNEPHLKFIFSARPERRNTIPRVPKKELQIALLEEAIRACGGDLNNLPNERRSGKAGFRARVRKWVGKEMTADVFNSTMKDVRRAAKERAAAKK